MVKIFQLVITVFMTFFVLSPMTLAQDSCDCPKLSCRTDCEIEQDLTFYSEKCDGGKRVKSCARPTCIPVQNPPAFCAQPAASNKEDEKQPERMTASEKKNADIGPVGKVEFVEGGVKRTDLQNNTAALNAGEEVYEGERVETDATGKIKIVFQNGNVMSVTPNSTIVITEMQQRNGKKVILDLLKGKVRNKVSESYNDNQSYFRVRTQTAVAGVRGTDFIVSVESDDLKSTSRVEALSGHVELSDSDFKEKTMVSKDEVGSYISPAGLQSDGTKAKGYLTPVTKMNADYISKLQQETDYSIGKNVQVAAAQKEKVVSKNLPICSSPSARLNECSWICENNPLGESKCRTDISGVKCVRRVCDANGNWSQPMRLPSSHREACKGNAPVIKACDF